MVNEPNLSDLRMFGLVAKHASFIAAARVANLAQTTVSKRVAMLEEALGVQLLHRTTRRVTITESGLKVLRWSKRILGDIEEMQADLSLDQGEPRGPIRISSASRLGRDYVAPALSQMKHRFPGIEVWLEIIDRRVDLVGDGFHLDFRSGEPSERDLIGHKIIKSSRIFCAAPSYVARHGAPQTLADVTKHECLLFRDRNEPFGLWRFRGPRGWDSVNVSADLASNDNDVVLRWAIDGHGIMIGTDWFFASSLKAGKLCRVLPDWQQPADVWAVSVERTTRSAKVRLCLEYLKEQMSALRKHRN